MFALVKPGRDGSSANIAYDRRCQESTVPVSYDQQESALQNNSDLLSFAFQKVANLVLNRKYAPLIDVKVERSFCKYKNYSGTTDVT